MFIYVKNNKLSEMNSSTQFDYCPPYYQYKRSMCLASLQSSPTIPGFNHLEIMRLIGILLLYYYNMLNTFQQQLVAIKNRKMQFL